MGTIETSVISNNKIEQSNNVSQHKLKRNLPSEKVILEHKIVANPDFVQLVCKWSVEQYSNGLNWNFDTIIMYFHTHSSSFVCIVEKFVAELRKNRNVRPSKLAYKKDLIMVVTFLINMIINKLCNSPWGQIIISNLYYQTP